MKSPLVESWATGYLNGNVSDLVVFGILIGFIIVAVLFNRLGSDRQED